MDSLTRVLVSLYEEPERPQNAIDYFLDRLASGLPMKAEMENLQSELTDLRKKVKLKIHFSNFVDILKCIDE